MPKDGGKGREERGDEGRGREEKGDEEKGREEEKRDIKNGERVNECICVYISILVCIQTVYLQSKQ